MNSVQAIHNRVGDIMQRVSVKMSRFESGPRRPEVAASTGAARFLQGQSAGGAGATVAGSPNIKSNSTAGRSTQELQARAGRDLSQTPAQRPVFAAELEAMIQQEARNQAVSPELIRAVVQAESGGRPDARSKAGAVGLMQLMPGTARELGVNPNNPRENIRGGVQYLNQMAGKFGDLDLALAAYNAGPGAVKKYGGVPPYRETIDYIGKIRKSLGEPAR